MIANNLTILAYNKIASIGIIPTCPFLGRCHAERSIKERAAEAAEKAGVGKVVATTSKVYLTRLSRAFIIILGAAATTAAAMLPLLVMGFGALTGFALIIILGVFLGTVIARPAYGRIIGYIMAVH